MPDYCNFECTSLSLIVMDNFVKQNVKTTILVVIQEQHKYEKTNQNYCKEKITTTTTDKLTHTQKQSASKKVAFPVPGMTPIVYKDDTNIFSRGNSDL